MERVRIRDKLSRLGASSPRFGYQTLILVLLILLWNIDALKADEGACGRSELLASEIRACVTSVDNCESLGTLTQKVVVFDEVRARADRSQTKEKSNGRDRMNPSLIYFEVVKPTSVRFSGKGYRRLFLFEIDGRSVRTTFQCVRNSTKWLSPGRYILQGYSSANFLSWGKKHLTLDPVSIESETSNGETSSSPPSSNREEMRKTARESSKLIQYSTRFGLILGVILFVWLWY